MGREPYREAAALHSGKAGALTAAQPPGSCSRNPRQLVCVPGTLKVGCLGEPSEGKWASFDSCVSLPSSLASDSALRVYDEPANRDVRTLR